MTAAASAAVPVAIAASKASDLLPEGRQRRAAGSDLLAEILDLPLGGQDAARLGAAAAADDVGPAVDLAIGGDYRQVESRRQSRRFVERRHDHGVADDRPQAVREEPAHADDARQQHRPFGQRRRLCRRRRRRCAGHDEAAPSGVLAAHQLEAGVRLAVAIDDHVLQQLAEHGLHRPLETGVDVEVVGERAVLPDRVVGAGQEHPRAVAEGGARRIHLFERSEPGRLAGQVVLALPRRPLALLVLAAGLRQSTLRALPAP